MDTLTPTRAVLNPHDCISAMCAESSRSSGYQGAPFCTKLVPWKNETRPLESYINWSVAEVEYSAATGASASAAVIVDAIEFMSSVH